MTNSTKILIFHVSAGGGHKAAARAIAEAGEARGFSCEVVDALDLTPPWFARAYVGTHLRSTEHPPAPYAHGYAPPAIAQVESTPVLPAAAETRV